jgi:hypothetical protein
MGAFTSPYWVANFPTHTHTHILKNTKKESQKVKKKEKYN